jgi:hypothetical protein
MESQVKDWMRGYGFITEVDLATQRKGVDFLFQFNLRQRKKLRELGYTSDNLFEPLKVEVKHDKSSGKTGNYYIELEAHHKPGWALTCTADILIIVSGDNDVVFTTPGYIREYLESWKSQYKVISYGRGGGGVLVPCFYLHGTRGNLDWKFDPQCVAEAMINPRLHPVPSVEGTPSE